MSKWKEHVVDFYVPNLPSTGWYKRNKSSFYLALQLERFLKDYLWDTISGNKNFSLQIEFNKQFPDTGTCYEHLLPVNGLIIGIDLPQTRKNDTSLLQVSISIRFCDIWFRTNICSLYLVKSLIPSSKYSLEKVILFLCSTKYIKTNTSRTEDKGYLK